MEVSWKRDTPTSSSISLRLPRFGDFHGHPPRKRKASAPRSAPRVEVPKEPGPGPGRSRFSPDVKHMGPRFVGPTPEIRRLKRMHRKLPMFPKHAITNTDVECWFCFDGVWLEAFLLIASWVLNVSSMPQVIVALASGRSVNLSVPQSSKVVDLKILAQQALGQGFLKLMTAEGQVLTQPGESVGMLDGDRVSAIAWAGEAFALWCCGGGVVTYGNAPSGGDSSRIQVRLINVQQVKATCNALLHSSQMDLLFTWGDPSSGGDSSEDQPRLRHVHQIQAASQLSLQINLLLHGEMLSRVAAALKSKTSSKMCSRFRLQVALLLRSWEMGLLLYVGDVKLRFSSPSSAPKSAADKDHMRIFRWSLGRWGFYHLRSWSLFLSTWASGCEADSGLGRLFCCRPGR